MGKKLIYLASAYSHKNPFIRFVRYVRACIASSILFRQGYLVFSPIAHSHPICIWGSMKEIGFEHWKEIDLRMIGHCDCVYVLMSKGWEKSKGVAAEIDYALLIGKVVYYVYMQNNIVELYCYQTPDEFKFYKQPRSNDGI